MNSNTKMQRLALKSNKAYASKWKFRIENERLLKKFVAFFLHSFRGRLCLCLGLASHVSSRFVFESKTSHRIIQKHSFKKSLCPLRILAVGHRGCSAMFDLLCFTLWPTPSGWEGLEVFTLLRRSPHHCKLGKAQQSTLLLRTQHNWIFRHREALLSWTFRFDKFGFQVYVHFQRVIKSSKKRNCRVHCCVVGRRPHPKSFPQPPLAKHWFRIWTWTSSHKFELSTCEANNEWLADL